jgi:hypothetical protein
MNDRPDAAELLAIAHRELLDHILPLLAEESRYSALMIANAMAIAARELAGGEAAAQAELARLSALWSEPAEPTAGAPLAAALAGYNRRLTRDIRAGRYDGKGRGALLEHLEQTARDQLAISNPKALK